MSIITHCILFIDLYSSFSYIFVLRALFYADTVPSFQRIPRRVIRGSKIAKESLMGWNNIGCQAPSAEDCATENRASFSPQEPSENEALDALLLHSITNPLSKLSWGPVLSRKQATLSMSMLFLVWCTEQRLFNDSSLLEVDSRNINCVGSSWIRFVISQ